jgi:YidC/Oxa1 family membrane protein insertase
VLQSIAQYNADDPTYTAQGVFQWEQYASLLPQAHDAEIFGVPLYATFMDADQTPNPMNTRILAIVMILLMTATSFITQRQLIVKNSAPDNPMVKQQKILLYVFPLIFAVSGINFPIGVLIYWFTTNVWSMGQQFYVIRNNPQPGTPAHEAKEARKAAKQAAQVGPAIESIPDDSDTTSETTRQQPKKTSRSQRKKK